MPSVTLGSGIDLDKVQTIMESMGSKLSPGAQQLLDMVRFQQKVSYHLQNTVHKMSFLCARNRRDCIMWDICILNVYIICVLLKTEIKAGFAFFQMLRSRISLHSRI